MKQNFLALTRAKFHTIRSSLRRTYFKLLGLKIKKGGSLGRIICEWPNKLEIGSNCEIQDEVRFWIKAPFSNENYIKIGDRVFIGCGSDFNCNSKIIIGNDCLIASNTTLVDICHQFKIDSTINEQPCDVKEIVIGDDVWIGTGCIILKGVTVGKGSIIGAGSLVNKPIPEYEIWAGCPARKIGERNKK